MSRDLRPPRAPAALLLAALALSACASQTTTAAPYERAVMRLRVPSQQRLMSESVEQAVAALDFRRFAGRTAYVEVNGLFTHSHRDYLDFVQGAVEARLTAQGVLVRPFDLELLRTLNDDEQGVGAAAVPLRVGDVASASPHDTVAARVRPNADLRVVVNVAWGGVDRATRREVDTGRAAVEGVGAVLSTVLLGVGLGVDGTEGTAMMASGAVGLGATTLAFVLAPPTRTFERLDGRARLLVTVISQVAGVEGAALTAEGNARVDADPTAGESYAVE